MKVFILIFSLAIPFLQDGNLKDIGTAIKAGSAKELMNFCNQTIEIKINGESSNYSKAQAEVVLRKFFSDNPAESFNYIHQGAAPEGLKYTIGRYISEGASFRVVMVIKQVEEEYLIDTINFTKD